MTSGNTTSGNTTSGNTQWDYHLKNLGEWQGSFTKLAVTTGQVLEDTPTTLVIEPQDPEQAEAPRFVRLSLTRWPSPSNLHPPQPLVWEYGTLSPSLLFTETGAFSQGTVQYSSYGEFGAEFSLMETRSASVSASTSPADLATQPGDRRLRVVMFYRSGVLESLTLIREARASSGAPPRPPLHLDDLLGHWQSQVTHFYPNGRSPQQTATRLHLERQGSRLIQHFSSEAFSFSSEAEVEARTDIADHAAQRLLFGQGTQPVQVLLLPDGASITTPTAIVSGKPFFLEIGWLMAPNQRQRLVRHYDARGEWTHVSHVTERRVEN
jgi:hypothetical protein